MLSALSYVLSMMDSFFLLLLLSMYEAINLFYFFIFIFILFICLFIFILCCLFQMYLQPKKKKNPSLSIILGSRILTSLLDEHKLYSLTRLKNVLIVIIMLECINCN